MHIIPCYDNTKYSRMNTCNPMCIPKVTLQKFKQAFELKIHNACYCKIRQEIGEIPLLGGSCTIEPLTPMLGNNTLTIEIRGDSTLSYIVNGSDHLVAIVPTQIDSSLFFEYETFKAEEVKFTFDKFPEPTFKFIHPNLEILKHLLKRLKIDETLVEHMLPSNLDAQSVIRISKYTPSDEIQHILSTLETSIANLDEPAINQLRGSKYVYDIGADNFFDEVIYQVKKWKSAGHQEVKRCKMKCTSCFEGKEVLGFQDESGERSFGLCHLFDADAPIEVYGCNHPVALDSTEPIDFPELGQPLNLLKTSIDFGHHGLLDNLLAPNCQLKIDFHQTELEKASYTKLILRDEIVDYLIDKLEESAELQITTQIELGIDSNRYMDDYPLIEVTHAFFTSYWLIEAKDGKITSLNATRYVKDWRGDL